MDSRVRVGEAARRRRSRFEGIVVTITLDRYGHLLPGNETETARLLDAWLTKAVS
jgi:hypothetical protein